MKVILTSWMGGSDKVDGKRIPGLLSNQNGCLDIIRAFWPEKVFAGVGSGARVLMICANPEDHEKNDSLLYCFRQALPMSGLPVASVDMCDDRNTQITNEISQMDVIILTGGHVPTQNMFFRKIGLKEKLGSFGGLLLAWSAGSMNCAGMVYAGPELPGEASDPGFLRWIPGLGLTDINIFPHFSQLRDEVIDGFRMVDDIAFADSRTHEIIALNDGSFIVIDNGEQTLYGEAYRIRNGKLKKICENGESLEIAS